MPKDRPVYAVNTVRNSAPFVQRPLTSEQDDRAIQTYVNSRTLGITRIRLRIVSGYLPQKVYRECMSTQLQPMRQYRQTYVSSSIFPRRLSIDCNLRELSLAILMPRPAPALRRYWIPPRA